MGIWIKKQYLTTLLFSDDQIIMASNEQDVNYMLGKLQK